MKHSEIEFTHLVKHNKSSIYTVCYMFSNDADEVADMFQETLINLWNGFEKFKGESSVSTWVYRVALNTCISYERKKKRHSSTVPLSMEMNLWEDNDSNTRQIRQLRERIKLLAPFDRAIILLWLEDMSYQEIASIVGISVKNVSVRLLRIKEQLKKMSQL